LLKKKRFTLKGQSDLGTGAWAAKEEASFKDGEKAKGTPPPSGERVPKEGQTS